METGRTFQAQDMAKVYCEKCNGCGDCCHGMSDTIHLDPYDVDQLSKGLGLAPQELFRDVIALHADGGMILPHLHMLPDPDWKPAAAPASSANIPGARAAAAAMGLRVVDDMEGSMAPDAQTNPGVCRFLKEDGRCAIHAFRPGFCRLFPLGRDYDADTRTFRYFIVDNGCPMPGKMKVRISKWLGVPNLTRYERYISDWHYFCREVQAKIASLDELNPDGTAVRGSFTEKLTAFILQVFYLTPYDPSRDFYELFDLRLAEARKVL
ncbi:Putative zinc-or iron-chelating domain-containing protein [Lachnospiraceae bacterium NK3A20]|nr:Putative zinc-or iron-chelating domain-containing protein [Lachnospiraceae bacterium NK3A20]